MVHKYGRSPVWMFEWSWRVLLDINLLPHTAHLKRFSPEWIFRWQIQSRCLNQNTRNHFLNSGCFREKFLMGNSGLIVYFILPHLEAQFHYLLNSSKFFTCLGKIRFYLLCIDLWLIASTCLNAAGHWSQQNGLSVECTIICFIHLPHVACLSTTFWARLQDTTSHSFN